MWGNCRTNQPPMQQVRLREKSGRIALLVLSDFARECPSSHNMHSVKLLYKK